MQEIAQGQLKASRRYLTLLIGSLALIGLTCVAFLLPVPYVTMKPGPVFNTLGDFDDKPMFTFADDVKTYPTSGSLDFTTVSVTRADAKLSLVDAVQAYFSADVMVVPKSLVYPENKSAKESTAEGAAQLDSSKDSSRVAALRAAGYKVGEVPVVSTVSDAGAAAGKLKPDDAITKVDGRPAGTVQELIATIGELQPGDRVALTIKRRSAERVVKLVTKPDPQNPKVPRIGVGLSTKYDFPFEIQNNVGHSIGGPSAGTMFALAIYDRLTPGDLTGGEQIAGTGEISSDGKVGPIGGISQKIAGAAAANATIFLVPAANCAEAVQGDAHGLKLLKISTLDGAISSLEKLADDAKAKVPTCR